MNSRRSASVGALPREKKHFVSRNESASGVSLDVRCACQYFESDSLLPERINPVDSRPTSKLDFHSDFDHAHYDHEQHMFDASEHHPTSLVSDVISKRSFNVGGQKSPVEFDRLSMRSGSARPSSEHNVPPVDLAFVEKYPELEETARSRGLIVGSIGAVNQPSNKTFVAGMRGRQMSVGALSFGMRDPDAISMHSGVSVRRISRSPSKTDIFVADINIPTSANPHRTHHREQFSGSNSRRNSNIDLYHTEIQATNKQVAQALRQSSPIDKFQKSSPPVHVRAVSPQRSPFPPSEDFRSAKMPISTDYMRPSENKDDSGFCKLYGDLMPQNRPIDVSKYNKLERRMTPLEVSSDFVEVTTNTATQNETILGVAKLRSREEIKDPLQRTVAELEEIAATRNVEDVSDRINLETWSPPSNIGDLREPSLHLDKETEINIVTAAPFVDVDRLVEEETLKAEEERNRRSRSRSRSRSQSRCRSLSRNQSPMRKRQLSVSPRREKMHLLQLPEPNAHKKRDDQSESHSPHKRQREASPIRTTQLTIPSVESHSVSPPSKSRTPERVLQQSEKKAPYSTRLKSIFKNSSKLDDSHLENGVNRRRQNSPSPVREKSSSPKPNKLLSMITKVQPAKMEIVSGTQVTREKKNEPMSVRVTETFCLKVDEMDQYSSRPQKPTQISTGLSNDFISRSGDDFKLNESASLDLGEAFVPIVLPSGNRSPYSSEIDIKLQPNEIIPVRSSREHSSNSQISMAPKGQLFSVPININNSHETSVSVPWNEHIKHIRSPSEAPADKIYFNSKLRRKPSFQDGRTQSQDRARSSAQNDINFDARITKTVSFNFDERISRLSDFENKLSQKEKEKNDFLDRTYFKRDHEYEPIGSPTNEDTSDALQNVERNLSAAIETLRDEMKEAEDLQRDLEERYFSSETTTPRTESRTDCEIHTSQVDSSALEELPLKHENRKKSFMASAQDRTRKMQAGFKNQAGRIKTKLRSSATTKKSAATSSPKAKERRRFKAPEFSKIKMPDIKRPEIIKFKEFKRPEFTKFNKPDMSKFKFPEKFSTLKLHRSRSLKENVAPDPENDYMGDMPQTAGVAEGAGETQKKFFEFNFGTYPRAFRKKKKLSEPIESSFGTTSAAEGQSIIPSTDTQPSFESSSSPQGDRGPGPVRSRWADKFSDVSYNDSEGSRYRRYGSEQESFDRESSLERRMKDDLEDTESEAAAMGIMGRTPDNKQFAEFDEENRAIHEISNLRAGEFKRRPMVHQDSDLRSEDSRDAIGWTEREIEKIKLLRKAELEGEPAYLKLPPEGGILLDTQSNASSGKKVVMEEIDDDEFFLRKRGVSEDNIELRQYISKAIREGYDLPVNTLKNLEDVKKPIEYADYDMPPAKPRRLHKTYRPQDTSQELGSQRSDYGDDLSMSQNDSDFLGAPKRPMRKGRSHSKYSMDSQEIPPISIDEDDIMRRERYFDDDEDYLRPPQHSKVRSDVSMNNLDYDVKGTFDDITDNFEKQPEAPRRRKRNLRETSIEKDSFVNSLSGRSVSNNYLQPTEDVIVYRTEHKYHMPPLATPENYTDGSSIPSRKSRLDGSDDNDLEQTSTITESDIHFRYKYEDEAELDSRVDNEILVDKNSKQKFVIDMIENDGYAVVRKEQMPKPTPPARRKKFSRSPGERFTTVPSTPPPERPPPPRGYKPLDYHQNVQQKGDEDDYEEPGFLDNERPESPRNLQSGEIINKMKFRPLPPPPRPPREKRQRTESKRSTQEYDEESESNMENLAIGGNKRLAVISSDESYAPSDDVEDLAHFQEVEVSTQTDPLPDDFVCEEFEITDDMRIIEPRFPHRQSPKTLEDLLKEEEQASAASQMTEDEQLALGLHRFRDANQRSLSEKSRASSQADRSKSLSRPQTPSAIIIERRVSTPVPSHNENETMLEAALIVRPIDDLDLEEEALRREGLLTDSSQQSRSDIAESKSSEPIEDDIVRYDQKETSLTPSFSELEKAIENFRSSSEAGTKTEEEKSIKSDVAHEPSPMKQNLLDCGYVGENRDHSDQSLSNENIDVKDVSNYYRDRLRQFNVETGPDEACEEEKNISSDNAVDYGTDEEVPPPQPPPRRKSTIAIDPTLEITNGERNGEMVKPQEESSTPATHSDLAQKVQLPTYVGDLEVERLRVRALQAGQIMVSQLHGGQISAEELECKSGNLVVNGVELPAGFIENIVDRVRQNERGQLLTAETQTSLQSSAEILANEQTSFDAPPPKPPRHKEADHNEQPKNDGATQTDVQQLPPVFATSEYIETLLPLLRRDHEQGHDGEINRTDENAQKCQHHQCHSHHHHHHRHHHHRRCSSSSSELHDEDLVGARDIDSDGNYRPSSSSSHRHHSRSRSRTRPPSECPSQSVSQAGRQFISACSISLVNIIDQLSACIRGGDVNKNQDTVATDARMRQVPALIVIFIVITFGVLLFLLSGRSVHTHHWDFFNPPGNEGRQS